MKSVTQLTVLAMALGLSACSVNGYKKGYGCSGLPDGVVCKTPSQIYDLTTGDQNAAVYQNTLEQQQDVAGRVNTRADDEEAKGMFKRKQASNNAAIGSQEQNMVNLFSKPQFANSTSPMPILEQPRVLRIWVAPWRDQNDTLNWGSFMFTEITPRRWNFGDVVMRNTPITAPNQSDYQSGGAPAGISKKNFPADNASGANTSGVTDAVSDVEKKIEDQANPQPVVPNPLSNAMQRQNDLIDQ